MPGGLRGLLEVTVTWLGGPEAPGLGIVPQTGRQTLTGLQSAEQALTGTQSGGQALTGLQTSEEVDA